MPATTCPPWPLLRSRVVDPPAPAARRYRHRSFGQRAWICSLPLLPLSGEGYGGSARSHCPEVTHHQAPEIAAAVAAYHQGHQGAEPKEAEAARCLPPATPTAHRPLATERERERRWDREERRTEKIRLDLEENVMCWEGKWRQVRRNHKRSVCENILLHVAP